MKKRIVLSIIYLIAAFLIIPSAIIIAGFATPSQFSATYYAVLSDMYCRLKSTKGKKIIIIGTSSVAFGVDSALMESQLSLAGEDYAVVNFGLYGALGTKIMLDLSEKEINEGDVVIFAPEPHPQAMSLYFSATDTWYAADEDYSILKNIKKENVSEMTGGFPAYAAKKFGCLKNGPASGSGIYARKSFDERCDLKNYERLNNILSGGYDANHTVSLNGSVIDKAFIEYVNAYCGRIGKNGAKAYFSFAPVNAAALVSSPDEIESYYEFISENFDCPIISNPFDYIMDKEWFYDSNFHLNSAGMTVRTVMLLNDIKNSMGITAPTEVELPEKPDMPQKLPSADGDNSFVEDFEYEQSGDGYIITALAPSAKQTEYITIPASYNGKPVMAFAADVFAGNKYIREIIVQENITVLYNGSFDGCTQLKKVILKNGNPSSIGVGQKLLCGADLCHIYVPESALGAYVSNYFWSYYAERIAAF